MDKLGQHYVSIHIAITLSSTDDTASPLTITDNTAISLPFTDCAASSHIARIFFCMEGGSEKKQKP